MSPTGRDKLAWATQIAYKAAEKAADALDQAEMAQINYSLAAIEARKARDSLKTAAADLRNAIRDLHTLASACVEKLVEP